MLRVGTSVSLLRELDTLEAKANRKIRRLEHQLATWACSGALQGEIAGSCTLLGDSSTSHDPAGIDTLALVWCTCVGIDHNGVVVDADMHGQA